jgi:predicted Zn-dependent peptidase
MVSRTALTPCPVRADGDFRATPPPPRESAVFVPPTVKETRLKNGTRVLVLERHDLPIVAVNVVSDVGAASAPPGIAEFSTAVAERGVAPTSFMSDSRERSSRARIDTDVSFDSTTLTLKVLSTQLEDAVAYLADMALRPAFRDSSFNEVRAARLTERRGAWTGAVDNAYASIYPAPHPLHDNYRGTEAQIAAASPEQLRAYWRRAFSVEHVTIVVVGDVTEARAVSVLESTFALPSAGAGAATAPIPVLPPTKPRHAIVLRPSSAPQSLVVLAGRSPARTAPDYYAMRIVNELLGGGMTSRVFSTVRGERGFSYGVYSTLETRRDAGVFYVHGSIEREHTGEAVAQILVELTHLATELVTDAELARTKDHLIHRIPGQLETAAGAASSIAWLAVRHLSIDELLRTRERIQMVSREQVLAAAKLYADAANVEITVVGEPASIKAQLERLGLGPVELRQNE